MVSRESGEEFDCADGGKDRLGLEFSSNIQDKGTEKRRLEPYYEQLRLIDQ